MKTISLSQSMVALVDDEDYPELSQFKWSAGKNASGGYYAMRSVYGMGKGKSRTVMMHREIMRAPKGSLVDHKDNDGLNNQRHNLRLATGSQNQQNKRTRVSALSPFKGVWLHRRTGRWQARLTHERRAYNLGMFATAEDAALAYDLKAKELFGEFAKLNFPEPILKETG